MIGIVLFIIVNGRCDDCCIVWREVWYCVMRGI